MIPWYRTRSFTRGDTTVWVLGDLDDNFHGPDTNERTLGGFVLIETQGNPAVATEIMDELTRRYVGKSIWLWASDAPVPI